MRIAFALAMLGACAPNDTTDAPRYATELEECTRVSETLCESIRCENHYRAIHGRPARAMPARCTDGGTP